MRERERRLRVLVNAFAVAIEFYRNINVTDNIYTTKSHLSLSQRLAFAFLSSRAELSVVFVLWLFRFGVKSMLLCPNSADTGGWGHVAVEEQGRGGDRESRAAGDDAEV